MLGRRVRYSLETVDRLEGRSLPSALFSPRVVHILIPEEVRRPSDYAEIAAAHPAAHATSGGGNLAGTIRLAHTTDMNSGTSAAVKAPTGSIARRAVAVSMTDREPPIADTVTTGRPGLLPVEPATDLGSEMVALASVNSNDSLLTLTSVVGWAPGTTAPGNLSRFSGIDANESPGLRSPLRFGLIMTSGWPGHFFAGTESLPPGGRSWPGPRVDELQRLAIVTTASDLDGESPAWAQLLEGGPIPDWDSIDQELRRLLLRVGGLAENAPAGAVNRNWLIGIVSGALATLTHRAAVSARRRRPRGGVRDAVHALPVGPWPLSPS